MVKTRLTKWGLHKKLQLPEMRTALQILGPDRSQWPSPAPQFRIHGRVVDLDTILRSYGRKGIREPFEWIRLTSDSDYERSSNVELISDSTPADSERELDEIGQLFELSTPATPKASAPTVSACVTRDWRCYPGVPSIVAQELRDPDIYLHSTTAIRHVQAYCLSYMTSARSQFHNEPEIHHLTSHARFLDRMDEGIVLFGREQMGMAFATFDKGFELLKEMFMDIHPMAVATYLLLLCKLTVPQDHTRARRITPPHARASTCLESCSALPGGTLSHNLKVYRHPRTTLALHTRRLRRSRGQGHDRLEDLIRKRTPMRCPLPRSGVRRISNETSPTLEISGSPIWPVCAKRPLDITERSRRPPDSRPAGRSTSTLRPSSASVRPALRLSPGQKSRCCSRGPSEGIVS